MNAIQAKIARERKIAEYKRSETLAAMKDQSQYMADWNAEEQVYHCPHCGATLAFADRTATITPFDWAHCVMCYRDSVVL